MWRQAGRGALETQGRGARLCAVGGTHGCGGRLAAHPAPPRRALRTRPALAPLRPPAACHARVSPCRHLACSKEHTRRAHLPAALLKVLAAQLRAGRGGKLADAARQRRLADVHHRHHIALALLKACRGAGCQATRCTTQAAHWQACAGKQRARRGCGRPGTARRRRCRTGGGRSASSRASWTPPAAARCLPPRSSPCQSPAGRRSGSCTGWGPPACAAAARLGRGARGRAARGCPGPGQREQESEAATAHRWNMGSSSMCSALHSDMNTAPSINTLSCSASLKSISMKGLESWRQMMYKQAAATCGRCCQATDLQEKGAAGACLSVASSAPTCDVRRPRVKFFCSASA